ncbi:MAG: radical SAM protein [Myxococcota bacterium]
MQLDFQDHRRKLHANRYVYAVVSRRAGGLSIGINLNPDKVCNFDCPYCQVDRSQKSSTLPVDVERLTEELERLLTWVHEGVLWSIPPFDTAKESHRRVADISFAGDGEPTSAKAFTTVIKNVAQLKRLFGLEHIKLQVLTNATLFNRPKVQQGLTTLWENGGEVWAKLDAGTEKWFQLIDGTNLPFALILRNIQWAARQGALVLQCMFHRWEGNAPSSEEISAWCQRLAEIYESGGRIRLIQVYSVARRPADPRVTMLEEESLINIANQARRIVDQYHQDTLVKHYPGLPV